MTAAPPSEPSTPRRSAAEGVAARHATGLVALAFLLVGLATLPDHGLTWDGPESYRAGAANLRLTAAALAGGPLPPWPWHELTGYQFVADTVRAALASAANRWWWEPGSYLGFHLVNLVLSTFAVWLVGRLATAEGGLPALGPLAAAAFALHPKLVGHAVANPKDVPGLVVWLLGVLALSRAARWGRGRDYAWLGAALGLAGATHVAAALLVPLSLLWILAAGHGSLRRRLLGVAGAGVVAAATGLACWPWLWPAPWERARSLLAHVGGFDVAMRVRYLGADWDPSSLPWHYGVVSLAIATPVLAIGAAALGAFAARGVAAGSRRDLTRPDSGSGSGIGRDSGGAAPRPGEQRVARLALLWVVLLVAADLAAPARYDGARHLLPALAPLAILAALGALRAGRALATSAARAGTPRLRRRLLTAGWAAAAALLAHGASLAAAHPYADAWLNLPARLAFGPEAQAQVELEYWGATYGEGCRWLRRHAESDARVLVPFASHVATPCLAGRFELVPHDSHPDASRPRYVMLMAREAWYTPRLRRLVATERPVYTVRRQGSTLLAIYRLPLATAVQSQR